MMESGNENGWNELAGIGISALNPIGIPSPLSEEAQTAIKGELTTAEQNLQALLMQPAENPDAAITQAEYLALQIYLLQHKLVGLPAGGIAISRYEKGPVCTPQAFVDSKLHLPKQYGLFISDDVALPHYVVSPDGGHITQEPEMVVHWQAPREDAPGQRYRVRSNLEFQDNADSTTIDTDLEAEVPSMLLLPEKRPAPALIEIGSRVHEILSNRGRRPEEFPDALSLGHWLRGEVAAYQRMGGGYASTVRSYQQALMELEGRSEPEVGVGAQKGKGIFFWRKR